MLLSFASGREQLKPSSAVGVAARREDPGHILFLHLNLAEVERCLHQPADLRFAANVVVTVPGRIKRQRPVRENLHGPDEGDSREFVAPFKKPSGSSSRYRF